MFLAEMVGRYGDTHLIESSLALEGAYVRIYQTSETDSACVSLNAFEAMKVIEALAQFVHEAFSGELTEPAEVDHG